MAATRKRYATVEVPPNFEDFCEDHGGNPLHSGRLVRDGYGNLREGEHKVWLLPDGAWARRSLSNPMQIELHDPPADELAQLQASRWYWECRLRMIEKDFDQLKR